ncbi:hypothetical protein IPH67_04760 [bacterium]|nr:MAG: hypothetical protein IPH67_04760 [bacterium]
MNNLLTTSLEQIGSAKNKQNLQEVVTIAKLAINNNDTFSQNEASAALNLIDSWKQKKMTDLEKQAAARQAKAEKQSLNASRAYMNTLNSWGSWAWSWIAVWNWNWWGSTE